MNTSPTQAEIESESAPASDAQPFDQLNALLDSIEQHPDNEFREQVMELVRSIFSLHHGALHRLLEIVGAQHDGQALIMQIRADELVSAVLLAHGLMPSDLETRVREALDRARPALQEHGADVELVSLENDAIKLRLIGGAASANVSTAIFKFAIEQALAESAPDLRGVEYEDVIAAQRPPRLVQITPRPAFAAKTQHASLPVIRAQEVPDNSMRTVAVGDINLLLCNVAGTIYAMHNVCAHRGLSLETGLLEGPVLTCPWHGYQFDLQRDGRCLNDPSLKLDLLPMSIENGVVKVALQPARSEE